MGVIMRVRTLATISTPQGEVHAGKIITIPEAAFDRLKGKVEVVTDTPGESIATARIGGDTCLIRYTPDLYQQHRHRNGEQITVDGAPVKLIIEEITP
jgi:hypothetical protein